MANGLFLSNSHCTSPPIISILKLGWSPSTERNSLHPTSEGAGRRRQPCQPACGESHLPEKYVSADLYQDDPGSNKRIPVTNTFILRMFCLFPGAP